MFKGFPMTSKRFAIGIVFLLLLGLFIVPVTAQDGQTVKVYTSWPLTGGTQAVGESMLNAANLALMHYTEDHEGMGPMGTTIEIVPLDDASPTTGAWDGTIEAENAQRCVNDEECLVYFGTYNSGAAKVSMPITNEAGMLHISPANTYAGLTRACETCEEGEPEIYRPTEAVNYYRIPVTDDVQGPAAASWAYCMGYDSVYIIDDAQAYGAGVANEFDAHAQEIGLEVLGHSSLESADSDPRTLLTDVVSSGAEIVFGGFVMDSGGPSLIQAMYDEGLFDDGVAFMGPDGLLTIDLVDQVGGAEVLNGNTFFTFSALLPNLLTTEIGVRFYEGYQEAYDGAEPDPYAIYAYTAMQVILDSIERGGDMEGGITRANILAAVPTTELDSALGTIGFDENGDSTLAAFYGYDFADGAFANPTAITPDLNTTCERP